MEQYSEKFTEIIEGMIKASIEAKSRMIEESIPVIRRVAEVMIQAHRNGQCTFWFGNGGSAADAQHMACELVSRFFIDRGALRSLALNTNTSNITAIANDYSYDYIFARQIEALARPGDILIGISTSGNSGNVIEGFNAGKKIGTINVALTGRGGGKMKNMVDHLIAVPSEVTPTIQECHGLVGHILCYLVEKELFQS